MENTPQRPGRRVWPISTIALAAAGSMCWLWADTFPTGHLLWGLAGVVLLIGAGLATVVWVIVMAGHRRFSGLILVGPLMVAATLAVTSTEIALEARFALAKPALEQAADSGECPSSVTSYRIQGCVEQNDGRFFRVDTFSLNAVGFVFFPDPPPDVSVFPDPESAAARVIIVHGLGDGWFWYVTEW